MIHFASKLIENLKLFYKSNRPHLLWVYQHDNPLGMLGALEKLVKLDLQAQGAFHLS